MENCYLKSPAMRKPKLFPAHKVTAAQGFQRQTHPNYLDNVYYFVELQHSHLTHQSQNDSQICHFNFNGEWKVETFQNVCGVRLKEVSVGSYSGRRSLIRAVVSISPILIE